MRQISIPTILISVLASVMLAGCSPKYNWREYSSPDAPYRVMFPDKPDSHTRSVDLNGMTVDMTMTAARVDGTTFAVGSAQAPDVAQAQAALEAMKTALVRNIGATVTKQAAASAATAGPGGTTQSSTIDIEATGVQNGVPMRLIGHFEARDKRFYQVIVMGKEKAVEPEQVDMFISSFKLI